MWDFLNQISPDFFSISVSLKWRKLDSNCLFWRYFRVSYQILKLHIWLWVDLRECTQTLLAGSLILFLQHSCCLDIVSILQLIKKVRAERFNFYGKPVDQVKKSLSRWRTSWFLMASSYILCSEHHLADN